VSLITDASLSLRNVAATKQQLTADGGVLSGTNTPCVPQKENRIVNAPSLADLF